MTVMKGHGRPVTQMGEALRLSVPGVTGGTASKEKVLIYSHAGNFKCTYHVLLCTVNS